MGDAGNDSIDGGPGNDTVIDLSGDNTIDGGPGKDTVSTGAGNDTVEGGPEEDTVDSGAGNDQINGGSGNDNLVGGDNRDTIDGGAGADTISGGAGGDQLTGGPEGESDGADTISGGESVDTISGGGGNDTLSGDGGDDTIFGGAGADSIEGGPGYDTAYGQDGGAASCANTEISYQCSSTTGSADHSLPPAVTAPADAAGCNAYADVNGDDGNPGTAAQPFRTPEQLLNSLRAGQVGCLNGGETFTEPDFELNVRTAGTEAEPILLETTPGSASRATIQGRIYVQSEAHDVKFENLKLEGQNPLATLRGAGAALPSPTIDTDRITFNDDDVSTARTATCFVVGSVLGYGRASNARITHDRIHDCGLPVSPVPVGGTDSGIDLENSRNALVENDLIYGSADRGILLFPDAQEGTIDHNALYGNARAIEFGGEIVPPSGWDNAYTPGDKVYPDNNSVTGNVIADSTLDFPEPLFQVRGANAWGLGAPQASANAVTGNCVYESDPAKNFQSPPIDFSQSGNTVPSNGAGFVNPAGGDFTLSGAAGTCPTSFGPH